MINHFWLFFYAFSDSVPKIKFSSFLPSFAHQSPSTSWKHSLTFRKEESIKSHEKSILTRVISGNIISFIGSNTKALSDFNGKTFVMKSEINSYRRLSQITQRLFSSFTDSAPANCIRNLSTFSSLMCRSFRSQRLRLPTKYQELTFA